MDKQTIIETLKLEHHIEGGYYRRSYASPYKVQLNADPKKERQAMTSIYYMLTTDSPIGYTHKNCSDILRYYQLGCPLRYLILYPNGHLEETILGPDLLAGHKLQLLTPGGTWVSTALVIDNRYGDWNFGLVSEAVTPGFDPLDRVLATLADIDNRHHNTLKSFIMPASCGLS